MKVGDMSLEEATTVHVDKAIVMVTIQDSKDNVILGKEYDIGLVFAKLEDISLMKTKNLKHLNLPVRYD